MQVLTWENDSCSASQEIFFSYGTKKFINICHWNLFWDCWILAYTHTFYFSYNYFNTILQQESTSLDLHLGGDNLKFWSVDWLYWMMFFMNFSLHQGKCWDNTSNQEMTSSSQIHSNSLITDHPITWCYIVWAIRIV